MSTSHRAELKRVVRGVVRDMPAADTSELITEVAKRMIKRRGWTAADGPTSRHAWPAYLTYKSPVLSASIDRSWLRMMVNDARQASAG